MKKAFTMMELIFVIVVIGILAAVVIPRTGANKANEAAIKLTADIRYAQHLAMVDDKFNSADATWYEKRWQVRFNGGAYSIVSNDGATFAKNPQDSSSSYQDINISTDYGVTLSFAPITCSIIGFDHLGRPMLGDLSGIGSAYAAGSLMTANCVIGIADGSNTVNITIIPETGYASF